MENVSSKMCHFDVMFVARLFLFHQVGSTAKLEMQIKRKQPRIMREPSKIWREWNFYIFYYFRNKKSIPMAKTDYQSIDEYQHAFPEDVQKRMQQIRKIINKIAPEAEEVISYQIPAFKIGKKFLIYYSAYAKHISLSSPWSEAFLQNFDVELNGLNVSKSAIQLPNEKPLPLELISLIVRFRKKEIK